MTPGQVAHDAGGFERKWERMGESQKADWERIAQAVLQAQPVQPATEYLQFLSDVMTAAGLVAHGKQCKALGERLRTGASEFRNIAQAADATVFQSDSQLVAIDLVGCRIAVRTSCQRC